VHVEQPRIREIERERETHGIKGIRAAPKAACTSSFGWRIKHPLTGSVRYFVAVSSSVSLGSGGRAMWRAVHSTLTVPDMTARPWTEQK